VDRPAGPAGFGALLRRWRTHRGLSQMALALDAEVSTRHLSWLETGRAAPSRAMVLRLAERLDVPLRERNLLLQAAGYAPLYAERPLADPALAPAREALQCLLDAHEPWPALAVDRHWNLVAANRAVGALLALVDPALTAPPVNVVRLSLHPQGLAPMIENLPAWRAHVLARLRRQVAATGDPDLQRLHDELRAPGAHEAEGAAAEGASPDLAVVPLVLRTPLGRFAFLTAVTVFGAPHEVTLAELAIETLLPADADTAALLRRLVGSAS
jgi:transcriptional regulator with XRE-family HTH domain